MTAIARAVLDILFAGLWQGACIAVCSRLAGALLGRQISATTRCAMYQVALVAVALAPIVTTLPRLLGRGVISGGFGIAPSAAVFVTGRVPGTNGFFMRGISIVLDDGVVLLLAALWALGVAVFGARLAAGSLQLSRLLRRSTHLDARDGVPLYESDDITVPLAFGFRRPSIIVPAALVREGGDDLDAIVLHELAHVRRADAWLQLFERAIQSLLFANPAVAFLLRSISLERESACDDWAVERSCRVDAYAHALAAFAVSGAGARAVTACGSSGFGRATIARINRLEDARRNGATTISRLALGGSFIVLALVVFAFQSLAPAVAFESQAAPHATAVVASLGCKAAPVRYLNGPPPDATGLPGGLRTTLNVRLSATGKIMLVTLRSSSGNARFDHAVIASAKSGTFSAATEGCRTVPGSYVFVAQTGP